MPSGPGADQLFAFFKAFLSFVSSLPSGPLEEILPTLFLVAFSHSFTPGSSLLTLPTVPTILVQKSLTTSIKGASLEVGTFPFFLELTLGIPKVVLFLKFPAFSHSSLL